MNLKKAGGGHRICVTSSRGPTLSKEKNSENHDGLSIGLGLGGGVGDLDTERRSHSANWFIFILHILLFISQGT